ncbi:MAG: FAD-dependent oxidoreductase [Rhodospirillaceae bacterium]|nr:FAD-dependent oxidoreductase [Rhodospirillaceae bacterium]
MSLRISRRALLAATPATLVTRKTRAAANPDVIIIGAGLSGLHAGQILEDAGLKVTVIEASNRLGGRVRTLLDKPQTPESGGSEVGPMYARVIDQIQRFGLDMRAWQADKLDFALNVGGTLMSPKDWPTSPQNKLPEAFRKFPPMALPSALGPKESGLAELDTWLENAKALPDPSLRDLYVSKGADETMLALLGYTAQADDLAQESSLWGRRGQKLNEWSRGHGPFNHVVGGMSKLPQAMAASLKGDIILNTPVESIALGKSSVTVKCANGRRFQAKRVLCTIPASVLRGIAFDPVLPALQAEAVASIPYGQATSVFFEIKEKFWEADGLGSSLWTDGPAGRAFNWLIPGGNYIWMYLAGRVNQPIRSAPEADIIAYATTALNTARPSTKDKITPIAAVNWSANPWSRGTFSYRAPGQIARYGNIAATPHGVVHFAGEHTAVLQSGLEGAMESGERAALEILEKS